MPESPMRSYESAWPDVPDARRAVMRANRRRDTRPELLLRSALHRAGLRFRVDFPVRPDGARPVRPDVVFPRQRLAVFVDGCFWHGCPVHWAPSRTNAAYWNEKVATNRARDARNTAVLEAADWVVLRFWEHEDVAQAARETASIRAQLAATVGSRGRFLSATEGRRARPPLAPLRWRASLRLKADAAKLR